MAAMSQPNRPFLMSVRALRLSSWRGNGTRSRCVVVFKVCHARSNRVFRIDLARRGRERASGHALERQGRRLVPETDAWVRRSLSATKRAREASERAGTQVGCGASVKLGQLGRVGERKEKEGSGMVRASGLGRGERGQVGRVG